MEGFRSQEPANELHVYSSNRKRMSIFLSPIDVQELMVGLHFLTIVTGEPMGPRAESSNRS